MNFHLAFLLYPGALILFFAAKIFKNDTQFKSFSQGKYQNFSYLLSIIIYLLIFYSVKK